MTDNNTTREAGELALPATALRDLKPIGFASIVDLETYAPYLRIGPHVPGVRDMALYTKHQLEAAVNHERNTAQSALDLTMQLNAWRAALIGLCSGPSSTHNTPELAAANVRSRLKESAKQPSGFAYEYEGPYGGIRFNSGGEVNGCKPLRAIPYYFDAHPTSVSAVPEGWKLVPITPTLAMLAAGCLNLPPMEIATAEEGEAHMADAWAGMLANTPAGKP